NSSTAGQWALHVFGQVGPQVLGVVVTANPYRGPGQYTGTTTVVQVHNLDNSGVWQSGAADPVAFAVNNDEESGTLQATLTSVANGTGKLKVSGRWACKTSRPFQVAGRFSRKADMPSWASPVMALVDITSPMRS